MKTSFVFEIGRIEIKDVTPVVVEGIQLKTASELDPTEFGVYLNYVAKEMLPVVESLVDLWIKTTERILYIIKPQEDAE